MLISKSKFMSGLQCKKRLWQDIHHRERKAPDGAGQLFIFRQGHEVGALAQKWRGPGTLIALNPRAPKSAVADTQVALAAGAERIYEAGFLYQDFLALADIIERKPDGTWRLIEVKATAKAKDIHVPDLAFQAWLMQQNGLLVSETGVMHLNTSTPLKAGVSLLSYTDNTAEVLSAVDDIPATAIEMMLIAKNRNEPKVAPGRHCDKPYSCPFKSHCWQDMPSDHLFNLPRLSHNSETLLRDKGWLSIADIEDAPTLTAHQQLWVDVIRNNRPFVNRKAITAWVNQLSRPIMSLDFETIAYAIPRWEGVRPYQQIPFQFSCHHQNQQGKRLHREYLHRDQSDPRPALAQALLDACPGDGSIIAWNAGFEKRIIRELAEALPHLSQSLNALLPRILDLMEIFRSWYLLPGALGSSSIKKVGIALLGKGADYANLSISQGDEAYAQWHEMVFNGGSTEIAKNLLEYCAQDTLLPLQLLNKTRGLFSSNKPLNTLVYFEMLTIIKIKMYHKPKFSSHFIHPKETHSGRGKEIMV